MLLVAVYNESGSRKRKPSTAMFSQLAQTRRQLVVCRTDVVDTLTDLVGMSSGADPGFLEEGFKSLKRGFVYNILPYFE